MLNDDIVRSHLVTRRAFILKGAKITGLSLLLSRMFYLQLIRGQDYKNLSDKNRINLVLLPGLRGSIRDIKGEKIAMNRSCFLVKLDKRLDKQYMRTTEKLCDILNMEFEARRDLFIKVKKASRRTPITIFHDASWEQVALIEEEIMSLPGIYIEQGELRLYNFPFSCGHITGYVGKISEIEMNDKDRVQDPVPEEFFTGKTGLEKSYENILQGQIGYKKIEVDATGLFVQQLERQDPIPGEDLVLNIDVHLQDFTYNLLPEEGGSAIVMDIQTGAILTAVSKGSYDPNEFAKGISNKSWKKLNNDRHKPLINKLSASQYPPGSTFKLITILAALEAGILPSQKFTCTGSVPLGNRHFHCWKKEGHGTLDMMESIKQSCNCYMFNVGRIIGAEKILEVARRFGLGVPTGVDFVSEAKGLLPDRSWKIRNFKYDWSLGDTFNISIGQGALLATPLQLAVMIAGIASGKQIVRPRFAKDAEFSAQEISVKKEHLEFLHKAMYSVVNEQGGSAYSNKSSMISFAGKTGTSQVVGKKNANDDLSRASLDWERKNHALFSGFTSFENPKYAISIIVDHGGGGGRVAGPVAKQIAEYIHSKELG